MVNGELSISIIIDHWRSHAGIRITIQFFISRKVAKMRCKRRKERSLRLFGNLASLG